MAVTQERYRLRRGVTLVDLEGELDRLWEALRSVEILRAEAEAAGVHLAQLPDGPRSAALAVKIERHSLDPITPVVVGSFIPLGARMVYDTWKKILLPRIERRFGRGVLTKAPTKTAAKPAGKKATAPSKANIKRKVKRKRRKLR